MDAEIKKALSDRLHELELRAARFGFDVPPEIINEIDTITSKLRGGEPAGFRFRETIVPTVDEIYWMLTQTNTRSSQALNILAARMIDIEHAIDARVVELKKLSVSVVEIGVKMSSAIETIDKLDINIQILRKWLHVVTIILSVLTVLALVWTAFNIGIAL